MSQPSAAAPVAHDGQPFLPLTATFGDRDTAVIWSQRTAIEAWCAVEVALADVQAELGDIPEDDAAAIRAWATADRVDPERAARRDAHGGISHPAAARPAPGGCAAVSGGLAPLGRDDPGHHGFGARPHPCPVAGPAHGSWSTRSGTPWPP